MDPNLQKGLSVPLPNSPGPLSPAFRRRAGDEDITKKDSKYKRYAANIDKALSLFEANSLQEWADYISFLGRLLKALQSNPSLPHIPSKNLVAKRLAQCLNPRLPSGVHQKTLEVYSYIFSLIGKEGLANDLTVWTLGLTPVLTYASINVKPYYLSLLETYYVPLGREIRPALRSLILALLPGIDEEGGEYFDRTIDLIDALRVAVNDDVFFWQSFLLATMTSPTKRQGSLAWLNKKMPKLDSEECSKSPLVTPEPGLLIRAFCAGLGDEQVLVQRGFLDLLVSHLPLKSPVLQKLVKPGDLQMLVTAAVGVVLRRDMSLNRRLWFWLLGPDNPEQVTSPSSEKADHFRNYGLQPLVKGLKALIELDSTEPSERAKPYRICLSLMDRWEVGGNIVPQLFMAVVSSVKAYENTASSEANFADVLKSASAFFDGVEAKLIWAEIFKLLQGSLLEGTEEKNASRNLEMARFIIKMFNVKEEEMITMHVPIVVAVFLSLLREKQMKGGKILGQALGIAQDLVSLIPYRAFSKVQIHEESRELSGEELVSLVHQFYDGGKRSTEAPFSMHQIAESLLRDSSALVEQALQSDSSDIEPCSKILADLLILTPKSSAWNKSPLITTIARILLNPTLPFPSLQGVSIIFSSLIEKSYLSHRQIDHFILPITQHLWRQLSPERPKYHVEAVKSLWNIQDKLLDRRVEAAIARIMTAEDVSGDHLAQTGELMRKFSVLWTHSVGYTNYEVMLTRPLFLFLDELAKENGTLHVYARAWLQNLQSGNKLFNILVSKLLTFDFLYDAGKRLSNGAPKSRRVFVEEDDVQICTYYLETMANIFKYASSSTMASLANEALSTSETRGAELREAGFDEDVTFQLFFATVALRAVDGEAPADDWHAQERVSKLHRAALSILHLLMESPNGQALAPMKLEDILIARLIDVLNGRDAYVQVALLDVVYAALKISHHSVKSNAEAKVSTEAPPKGLARMSLHIEREKPTSIAQPAPPAQLVTCLIKGFSSKSSRPVLDSWVSFLTETLPLLADSIFLVVIELVECICLQLKRAFADIRSFYESSNPPPTAKSSEATLVALLTALEHILAIAHERLMQEETKTTSTKTQAESSGFFGNMVSGVFAVESPAPKNATTNNRLTVLLCFQDTVKICYSIWAWGDSSNAESRIQKDSLNSFIYTSLRMRNKSRRILEHLFAAETLECLETLIELWPAKPTAANPRNSNVFKLINVLDGSRPKHTIPAIFSALYSRTNPNSLDPAKRSTLTAELSDVEVARFLVCYARSLEDDAMDEIWSDCMVFLKDVLANPFPHRGAMASLLEFTAVVGEKVDNTNFGEQKKLRKELVDVFIRLLTSLTTIRPSATDEKEDKDNSGEGVLQILNRIVPTLSKILHDTSALQTAIQTISTAYITPLSKMKALPSNLSAHLTLLNTISLQPSTFKIWRKDVNDLFSSSTFLQTSLPILRSHWVPLLKRWSSSDRDRLTDLLSKIPAPSTTAVLFGASARQETDKLVKATLQRICILLLSSPRDTFLSGLPALLETITQLLDCTPTTTPSSQTRAATHALIRTVVRRIDHTQLGPLWPLLTTDLEAAFLSLIPPVESTSPYADNAAGLSSARALLEDLLKHPPDEFQPLEFAFVRDSIDAVYDLGVEARAGVGVCEAVGDHGEVDAAWREWGRGLGIAVFEGRYKGEKGGEGEDEVWEAVVRSG